jgi:8-oxo-dGTP diphosphatase
MLQVVAGIIEDKGKVLLCQRHHLSKRFPLKWEFPGGKVEKGEDPEAAIIRELNEELGISVSKVEYIDRYLFSYPKEDPFELFFFKIKEYQNLPRNLQFEKFGWVLTSFIKDYDLLEGDLPFVNKFYRS